MPARRAVLLLPLLLAAPAATQTPPRTAADPLTEICAGFLDQNSLKVGGSADKLCGCLVREVTGQLSRSEMETYERFNAAARPLPSALQAKISGIAVQCLNEAR
jgi:hypothetical protein